MRAWLSIARFSSVAVRDVKASSFVPKLATKHNSYTYLMGTNMWHQISTAPSQRYTRGLSGRPAIARASGSTTQSIKSPHESMKVIDERKRGRPLARKSDGPGINSPSSGAGSSSAGVPESDKAKDAKVASMKAAIARINKLGGVGSAVMMDTVTEPEEMERISTGCLTLDDALGGGVAKGHIVEIYGPESSGKTSLALCILAQAQKKYPNDFVTLIDLEHAHSPAFSQKMGVSPTNFIVSHPDSGEKALQVAEELCCSGSSSVIVVDSVAALLPENEILREYGDPQVGSQARLMSSGLNKLHKIAAQHKVTLIFINQLRMDINAGRFGNPEVTSGGRALKYYAAQRIEVRRKEVHYSTTDKSGKVSRAAVGIKIKAKITKNKTAAPMAEAVFDLYYDRGIDRVGSIIDGAVVAGVIDQRGAYFYYINKGEEMKLGQGKAAAVAFLSRDENLQLLDTIYDQALDRLPKVRRGSTSNGTSTAGEFEENES